eukprot:403343196
MENVSHNTSYSEGSPNVKIEDEELQNSSRVYSQQQTLNNQRLQVIQQQQNYRQQFLDSNLNRDGGGLIQNQGFHQINGHPAQNELLHRQFQQQQIQYERQQLMTGPVDQDDYRLRLQRVRNVNEFDNNSQILDDHHQSRGSSQQSNQNVYSDSHFNQFNQPQIISKQDTFGADNSQNNKTQPKSQPTKAAPSHHKNQSSNLNNATDFDDEEGDEEIKYNQESLIQQDLQQEDSFDGYGQSLIIQRDGSQNKSPITQLTQRIIQLQVIFKTIDLIHYHKEQRLKLQNAFQELKINNYKHQIYELQEERKDSNGSLLFHQTKQLELNTNQDTFLLTGDSAKSDIMQQNTQSNRNVSSFGQQTKQPSNLAAKDSKKVQILDLNQQYRSDQIRQLLHDEDKKEEDDDYNQANSDTQRLRENFQQHERVLSKISNIQQVNNSSIIKGAELQSLQVLENLLSQLDNLREPESLSKSPYYENQNSIYGHLAQIKSKFSDELRTISTHYEEIERLRLHLNNKLELVEQMELENLEQHLVLEHRLKQSEEFKKYAIKYNSCETQTETSYRDMIQSEKQIELKKNEIEVTRFKERQEFVDKERILTRMERDLDIRERIIEEKRMEYTYKQRELNSRLMNAQQWPLSCLDNDQKLGEKLTEIKQTPDLFKGLALENDKAFQDFKNRPDHLNLLKQLQGTELYLKLESLFKYEYFILQERIKSEIVKEYMEGEMSKIESERQEISEERERYINVAEKERQLEDERRIIDQSRLEIQTLADNLKKTISQLIINEQLGYTLVGPNLSGSGNQANILEYLSGTQLNPSNQSLAQTITRLDFPFSNHLNINNGEIAHNNSLMSSQRLLYPYQQKIGDLRNSIFDQVQQQTSKNMMSSAMLIGLQSLQQNQEKDNLPFSKRIELIISQFEKLQDISVSQIDQQQKKQESSLESLKKVIMREAYFLEQEKRYLNEKSIKINQSMHGKTLNGMSTNNGHQNMSLLSINKDQFTQNQQSIQKLNHHSNTNYNNESIMMDGSKIQGGNLLSPTQDHNNLLIQENEYQTNDYTMNDEKKKVLILQQSLIIENEMNQSLNHQLNSEIERVKFENDKLIEMEKYMNEQKLKMLIKFEKIKQLEDYYNQRNPQNQVALDLEISDEEMFQALSKFREQRVKLNKTPQQKAEIILATIETLSQNMFVKGSQQALTNSSLVINQSIETKSNDEQLLTYFIMFWKMHTLQKRLEHEKTRNLLKSLDKESLLKLGLMPQFKKEFSLQSQEPVMDWFDQFWTKKSRELNIETYRRMNGEQLYLGNLALQNDMERFWKFRSQNILRMINLHMKRRARILLAFSFQQYKYQTQKAKVQFILEIKENVQNRGIQHHQKQYSITDSHTFMHMKNNLSDEDINSSVAHNNMRYPKNHQHNNRYDNQQQIQMFLNERGSMENSQDDNTNQLMNQMMNLNGIGTPKLADSHQQSDEEEDSNIIIIGTSQGFGNTNPGIIRGQDSTQNRGHIRIDTLDTHNSQTYTGISDIIMNNNMQNMKRNAVLTYLLFRKDSTETSRWKAYGLNKWKNFMRELEIWSVKGEIKRLINEVENMKFQEQLLRTSFRVQKSELESKVSELISFCMGSQQMQNQHPTQQAPISY